MSFFYLFKSFFILIYVILLLVTIVEIILVTSVWTFCFTCHFINNQSVTAGESVYASRKKRLFGIFGSMLIVYIICFFSIIIYFVLDVFIEVPEEYGLVATVCFVFITVANPIVQAYFRPEIKCFGFVMSTPLSMCVLFMFTYCLLHLYLMCFCNRVYMKMFNYYRPDFLMLF